MSLKSGMGVAWGLLPKIEELRKLAGQKNLALQIYCLLKFPQRVHIPSLFTIPPLGMPHDQNLLES